MYDDTYERLLEVWMREKNTESLTKISEDFLKDLSAYMSHLRRQQKLSDKTSLTHILKGSEISMIKALVESLLRLRLSKIFKVVSDEEHLENMLSLERRTYNTVLLALQGHLDSVAGILSNPRLLAAGKESRYEVVIFLKPSPKIVGVDMASYGPFREGDMAHIPAENAELLARRGVARRVQLA
ncbi:hypothetical protein HRbin01_00871 [archaeon HR01]|nr:hypothetical protein HRbin01_00871 [archaeon HR01]